MIRNTRLLHTLLAVPLLLAACTTTKPAPETPESEVTTPAPAPATPGLTGQAGAEALVQGQQAFGAALFSRTHKGAANTLISPYSVHVALGMTSAGGVGATASQMHQTLGTQKVSLSAFASQRDALAKNTRSVPEPLIFKTANRLFVQDGYKLVPSFVSTVKASFGALPESVNFIQDVEAARTTINTWVAQQTQQKIPELLKPGVLQATTRMVLTNAVYFKGAWQYPFLKDTTSAIPFHSVSKTSPVETMQTSAAFASGMAGDVRILSLPYQGQDADMLIVMPPKGQVDALATDLSGDTLRSFMTAPLERRLTGVRLPKFSFRTPVRLKKVLISMGMTDAFDMGKADFTGMNPDARKDRLHISAVVHEAFIAVDETGTEAAAATAVLMAKSASVEKPIDFFVDRPFLFIIRHTATNTPLFVGKVTEL